MATVPPYLDRENRFKSRTASTGLRPTQPLSAQQSVDQARQRMSQVGAGYTGSVWSDPGSYTAARPANTAPSPGANAPVGTAAQPSPNPTQPVRASTGMRPQGIDVRSYTGSMWPSYNPANAAAMAPRATQAPNRVDMESVADRALKARFGPPPNDRGQVDLSIDPRSRPVAPPQQTEAANPLTGTSTTQMPSTTSAINPGRAMGFTQRGAGVPRGMDATGGSSVGGTGLYARQFSNPQSAAIYTDYVKRLFG